MADDDQNVAVDDITNDDDLANGAMDEKYCMIYGMDTTTQESRYILKLQ